MRGFIALLITLNISCHAVLGSSLEIKRDNLLDTEINELKSLISLYEQKLELLKTSQT